MRQLLSLLVISLKEGGDRMTKPLSELYLTLRKKLKQNGEEYAELEAREIAACVAKVDKRNMVNWAHMFLGENAEKRMMDMVERRLSGEPLAYVLGEWDFYGLTFKVTKDVLIPRPDTEILCELAIAKAKDILNPRVLDLCCGSGCIGIAIAKNVYDARVTAIDISSAALAITHENARTHDVTGRYAMVCADAMSNPDPHLGQFHVIVSNPPYITSEEMLELDKSVSDYEPELALFGGEDGLKFYRSIAVRWKELVVAGGYAMVECGYRQAQQVAEIFESHGWYQIEIIQDYAGIDRVVCARMVTERI